MGIFRRIWALGKRSQLDREIEDELREHIRMRAEVNIAKGMTPEQAMRAARLRFGNPAAMKERVEARGRGTQFRKPVPRCALRPARIHQESRLHCRSNPHPGTRHRRQYRGLSTARRRASAQPAYPAAAGTGRTTHHWRQSRLRRRQRPILAIHRPHVAGGSTAS